MLFNLKKYRHKLYLYFIKIFIKFNKIIAMGYKTRC